MGVAEINGWLDMWVAVALDDGTVHIGKLLRIRKGVYQVREREDGLSAAPPEELEAERIVAIGPGRWQQPNPLLSGKRSAKKSKSKKLGFRR
jgi:hypothetical protein